MPVVAGCLVHNIRPKGAFFTRCLPIAFTFLPMPLHVWKKNSNPLKGSSADLDRSFDNHAKKLPPQSEILCSMSENDKKYKFFKKFFLPQIVPMNT